MRRATKVVRNRRGGSLKKSYSTQSRNGSNVFSASSKSVVTSVYRAPVRSSLMKTPKYQHSYSFSTNYTPIRLYASGSLPDHTPLEFPALSPTMEEGGIQEWEKKEGDAIAAGDVIAQIETDKTTIAWSSTEDGYLAKILVPAGTKGIKLNSIVAIMVADEKDIAAFKNYSGDSASSAPPKDPASQETKEPKEKQQSDQPTLKKGDANQELDKQHNEPQQQQRQAAQEQQPQVQSQSQGQSHQQSTQQRQGGDRVVASPYAKKLAQEKSIDLSQIQGTGPNNRVIAADVNEYQPRQQTAAAQQKQATSKPAAQAPKQQTQQLSANQYTDIPTSQMRRIIASRLLESKQTIPHYYLTASIRLDSLMNLRKQLNANSNNKYKLSVNDFVIKASALALKRVPEVNSQFRGEAIRRFNNVDVCVAVNTPDGLFTPIVFNADHKGLVQISENVKELAAKAKEKKLAMEEYQGGTFTVSNLGMFGVKHFAAVINPPQAAILAVGGVEEKAVVKEGGQGFEVGSVMEVTLSCDHRVVDGATGAQWLKEFKGFLEDPVTMLL
eukprot:TRINITY_DN4131_c0_g1_i1.p1 TRINITY_DN4131_c0_g1~~TRINITY_DN4131_c0_g1_i1.p1  ORF type:complete len:566 (-),score=233.04 TRINITY_DN4131_c0_g1_i1:17-1678(-)